MKVAVHMHKYDENDKPVYQDIEFQPGASLEFYGGGETEEGYHYWQEGYVCDENGTLFRYHSTKSRCCDGPFETYTDFVWNAETGEWDNIGSRQRDHYAESMGY